MPVYRKQQRLVKSLNRTSEEYAELLRTANVPIVVLDSKLQVVQWNAYIHRITGFSSETAMGSSLIGFFHESDRNRSKDIFEACLKGEGVDETYEFQLVCKNGNLRKFEVTLNLLRNESEDVVKIIMLGLDVTDKTAAHVAAMRAQKAHAIAETSRTMCESLPWQ